MCAICGCSPQQEKGEHAGHGHAAHAHAHEHEHEHEHEHRSRGSSPNLLVLERSLLAKNDRIAALNRAQLTSAGILTLNLVSSPGAGKTTILERTLRDAAHIPFAVIEGDQETDFDAARIRATGVPALQVNTGTGCHLDAAMVQGALQGLQPAPGSVLFIENVGNLVCPSLFDLGEDAKVVVSSVTEGEDKPLKYPHMFRASSLVLLNKMDLLPHVRFDVARFIAYARQVKPDLEVLEVTATAPRGLDAWVAWLERRRPWPVREPAPPRAHPILEVKP